MDELAFWDVIVLEVGLNGFVLLVEESEIRDEVFDDVHVWQWIDLAVFVLGAVDTAEACEGVLSVDVHCAGTADTFSAGPTECQCGIDIVLDFDKGIEYLGGTLDFHKLSPAGRVD